VAGSLSYGTASRIAVRELRSSRAKFAFVVLSVAIGVAALVGVRGFSASFRRVLLLRARSIMAADLSARQTQPLTPEETTGLAKLQSAAVSETDVTELLSMASVAGKFDPLLVAIKAVDPAKYPFYGDVKLSPAMPLQSALTDNTIAVGDDLLLRLHIKPGDQLQLGGKPMRIVAVVTDEPDRLSGMFAAGPRVLLSQHALETTGLLAQGSHATRRYLFKMTPGRDQAASDAAVAQLKDQVGKLLPEANVLDYREANPAVTKALDGATGLLSLMSLVALVLGAVGVAMAMRAHLQQRMDAIAIMKTLGAQNGHVMRIYLVQALLLGLLGGIFGALMGLGVQIVLPLFLEKLLHISPGFRVDPWSMALGMGAGLLTTLLFTLPPLLDIRGVRPILILRRNVEASDDPFLSRVMGKVFSSWAQLLATLVLLSGLAVLAATVSDSNWIGVGFAVALGILLLVLLAMSALMLWGLRVFLRGTRMSLPPVLRHGLSNLYRPGNPSAALLAALGLGVMQIATVYMVQHAIVQQMQTSIAEKLPNLFLIDISPDEVDGVRAVLKSQPQVQGAPELVPVVGSRMLSVDGVAVKDLKLEHVPKRTLQSVNLTWNPNHDALPPGDTVVLGKWFTADQAQDSTHPVVAVETRMAARLHVKPGSTLQFAAQDDAFMATVVATYEVDSQHASSRAEFVLPQAALKGLPVIWYGGVHCDPAQTAPVKRALFAKYPTVTVIDVAQTVEVVRQVILQITYVIQFLAAFSIFAGIVILASAIAGTRYRRVREVVVLKTLGGTRSRIATIFSIEFAVLGLVAGLVGLAFGNALARFFLSPGRFPFSYSFQPGMNAIILISTVLLAIIAGWAASFRVLGQKPLEVLREE